MLNHAIESLTVKCQRGGEGIAARASILNDISGPDPTSIGGTEALDLVVN